MQPYLLGIDIGTGSTKAVAVDFAGKPIAISQFHYPSHSPIPGSVEQEPELIWQAFEDCINDISKGLDKKPYAISLSSVMHSIIPVSTEGHALAPMITWADSRSASIADRIRQSPVGENIYRITGTPLYSMSPLCKIIWWQENKPELFKQAHKFISIKEYIWHKLFREFKTDHSVASATGLFDIQKLRWSTEALKLAGITEDQLSEPVATGYIKKGLQTESAIQLNISTDTPFVIGGSDGCMANLGSLAIQAGIAAITIGTSGAVRIASPKPIHNFQAMTFNYHLDEQTFICGGPINNGGIAVQWLLKNFLGKQEISKNDYAALFNSIDTVETGSEGLLFLPYLTGERAPLWDNQSCGMFFGIRMEHTQAHFLRAVIEGICYSLKDVLSIVETAQTITLIKVSGGFVISKTWMQMLADITGKRICLDLSEDSSAVGAVYMAMKALKIIENYSSLKTDNQVFIEPDLSKHGIYNRNFIIFRKLYQDLKDSMHQLYSIQT
jgi:gluconokinase